MGEGTTQSAANRLGLDYRREAERFRPFRGRIIDIHTHVNGGRAAAIFREVMDLYGVRETYTQTRMPTADAVRDELGDRARFIAIPDYMAEDKAYAMTEGFLRDIEVWHERYGARMLKFWCAPRLRDFVPTEAFGAFGALDSAWRIRQAELAQSLGMMLMAHVADPDTWFRTKYADASVYGTKASQYEPLERMLERFTCPWLVAHMGGWPEDLEFLDGLLSRHGNVYLDTSATKWQVRELSRHSHADFVAFFTKWKGRILFGTDIVTSDDHLEPTKHDDGRPIFGLASSPDEAFDLYASRFWALRTMFETDYEGESPIADPDLEMEFPGRYDAMSAPGLIGRSLPEDVLESLYVTTAEGSIVKWYEEH